MQGRQSLALQWTTNKYLQQNVANLELLQVSVTCLKHVAPQTRETNVY
jgi:hypothetical protein